MEGSKPQLKLPWAWAGTETQRCREGTDWTWTPTFFSPGDQTGLRVDSDLPSNRDPWLACRSGDVVPFLLLSSRRGPHIPRAAAARASSVWSSERPAGGSSLQHRGGEPQTVLWLWLYSPSFEDCVPLARRSCRNQPQRRHRHELRASRGAEWPGVRTQQ